MARSACSNCEAEVPRSERSKHDCLERNLFNYKEHGEWIDDYKKKIDYRLHSDPRLLDIAYNVKSDK